MFRELKIEIGDNRIYALREVGMGFISPAQHLGESRLDLNKTFASHPENMILI